MFHVRNRSGSCLFAAVALALLACSPVLGVPVLTLQSDVGTVSVEGRFGGVPGVWSDSYSGPVFGGISRQVMPSVVDEFGWPNSFAVLARVWEPAGPRSVGAFSNIEPSVGNTLPHIGFARVDVAWNFLVGPETAQFHASAYGVGGSTAQSGFSLYDETDGLLVANLVQGPGGSTSGQLLAGHEYTMNFFSRSGTSGSGDPGAGFEFTTNADIVPEPSNFIALATVAIVFGRSRRAWGC